MSRHHWILIAVVVLLAYVAWKRWGSASGGTSGGASGA